MEEMSAELYRMQSEASAFSSTSWENTDYLQAQVITLVWSSLGVSTCKEPVP